jgi:hypothetical protein
MKEEKIETIKKEPLLECTHTQVDKIKLSLLIHFASFLVSVLCFFFDGSLSKVIALPTALKITEKIAKRLPLLFANAFKSVKKRQLLLSQ